MTKSYTWADHGNQKKRKDVKNPPRDYALHVPRWTLDSGLIALNDALSGAPARE
jgi:hypothetical protein